MRRQAPLTPSTSNACSVAVALDHVEDVTVITCWASPRLCSRSTSRVGAGIGAGRGRGVIGTSRAVAPGTETEKCHHSASYDAKPADVSAARKTFRLSRAIPDALAKWAAELNVSNGDR